MITNNNHNDGIITCVNETFGKKIQTTTIIL